MRPAGAQREAAVVVGRTHVDAVVTVVLDGVEHRQGLEVRTVQHAQLQAEVEAAEVQADVLQGQAVVHANVDACVVQRALIGRLRVDPAEARAAQATRARVARDHLAEGVVSQGRVACRVVAAVHDLAGRGRGDGLVHGPQHGKTKTTGEKNRVGGGCDRCRWRRNSINHGGMPVVGGSGA